MSELRLHAVGDLMFHGPMAERMRAAGDPLWALRPLGTALADCDVLCGNFETPISHARQAVEGAPDCYFSPPGVGRALRAYGFSAVSLAHNHIYDFGREGVEATLAELDEAGLAHFGIGRSADEAARPAVIRARSGAAVGFLGYTTAHNALNPRHEYVACAPEPQRVAADVRRLREQVPTVIVSCHTGAQFNPYPAPEARALARAAVDAGAAVFLGHHPHVPQGCERIGRGLAVYSLGDFLAPVMNEQTRRTFYLRARVQADEVLDFEQVPCYLTDTCQTTCATGDLAAALAAEFERLNRAVADGRSDELHFAFARGRFMSQYVGSWWTELRRGGPGVLVRKFRNLRPYHLQLIWYAVRSSFRRRRPRDPARPA